MVVLRPEKNNVQLDLRLVVIDTLNSCITTELNNEKTFDNCFDYVFSQPSIGCTSTVGRHFIETDRMTNLTVQLGGQ